MMSLRLYVAPLVAAGAGALISAPFAFKYVAASGLDDSSAASSASNNVLIDGPHTNIEAAVRQLLASPGRLLLVSGPAASGKASCMIRAATAAKGNATDTEENLPAIPVVHVDARGSSVERALARALDRLVASQLFGGGSPLPASNSFSGKMLALWRRAACIVEADTAAGEVSPFSQAAALLFEILKRRRTDDDDGDSNNAPPPLLLVSAPADFGSPAATADGLWSQQDIELLKVIRRLVESGTASVAITTRDEQLLEANDPASTLDGLDLASVRFPPELRPAAARQFVDDLAVAKGLVDGSSRDGSTGEDEEGDERSAARVPADATSRILAVAGGRVGDIAECLERAREATEEGAAPLRSARDVRVAVKRGSDSMVTTWQTLLSDVLFGQEYELNLATNTATSTKNFVAASSALSDATGATAPATGAHGSTAATATAAAALSAESESLPLMRGRLEQQARLSHALLLLSGVEALPGVPSVDGANAAGGSGGSSGGGGGGAESPLHEGRSLDSNLLLDLLFEAGDARLELSQPVGGGGWEVVIARLNAADDAARHTAERRRVLAGQIFLRSPETASWLEKQRSQDGMLSISLRPVVGAAMRSLVQEDEEVDDGECTRSLAAPAAWQMRRQRLAVLRDTVYILTDADLLQQDQAAVDRWATALNEARKATDRLTHKHDLAAEEENLVMLQLMDMDRGLALVEGEVKRRASFLAMRAASIHSDLRSGQLGSCFVDGERMELAGLMRQASSYLDTLSQRETIREVPKRAAAREDGDKQGSRGSTSTSSSGRGSGWLWWWRWW